MPKSVTLNDSVWRKLKRQLRLAERAHVRVGVLAAKGGGKPTADGSATMTEIAAIHELGAPSVGIDERSFIRRTFREKEKELAAVTAGLAKRMFKAVNQHVGVMGIERALNTLGAWGATEVKKTIAEGKHIPPPLSAETKERKGSDRPLVDTGRLVQSIQWQVML